MDKRKIKNAMALIGLMGILLYGACGSEKTETDLYWCRML